MEERTAPLARINTLDQTSRRVPHGTHTPTHGKHLERPSPSPRIAFPRERIQLSKKVKRARSAHPTARSLSLAAEAAVVKRVENIRPPATADMSQMPKRRESPLPLLREDSPPGPRLPGRKLVGASALAVPFLALQWLYLRPSAPRVPSSATMERGQQTNQGRSKPREKTKTHAPLRTRLLASGSLGVSAVSAEGAARSL